MTKRYWLQPTGLVLLLGLTVAAGPAGAGQDRAHLDLRPASRLRDGQIEAALTVANKSQTPIRDWQVEAMLGDATATSRVYRILSPGKATKVNVPLGPAPRPAGVRTIVFRLRYRDAGGREHSTIASIPLVTADIKGLSGPIALQLDPPRRRARQTHLMVRHNGDEPVETGIRLYLPDSSHTVASPTDPLRLDPGATIKERVVLSRQHDHHADGGPDAIVIADYLLDGMPWSLAQQINWPTDDQPAPWNARLAWTIAVLALLAAWLVLQRRDNTATRVMASHHVQRYFDSAVLIVLTLFTAWHGYPQGWFMDTLATGGDIPAHNFLASHLKETLFSSGRLVSWAQGWWAGFPMFQFYFPLPYTAIAILSTVIPFNVAFKLVSVAGLLSLPVCAYALARATRLPRPGPILTAIAMMPLLFTRAHEMWGVNIYSTLAGMIGNSLGFSLMLLFLASAWRDADNGRFRLRTALLLSALTAAHFFTTLIAVAATAIMPLLEPEAGFKKSASTLIKEGLLGFSLMAWWLVPLAAKIDYSVAFGANWDVRLHETLPGYSLLLAPFVFTAIGTSLWTRARSHASADRLIPPARRLTLAVLLQWILLVSTGLFLWGSRVAAVFVNIRLWPFFFFAWLALAAAGLGWVLRRGRVPELAVVALVILTLSHGIGKPNDSRAWARWNYEGAERKPGWPVLETLVLPLDGTPGRLAYDLHPDNNRLGSTRIFESVPHLIDKPILEGGIVNSAVGALFAYRIQGESSQASAGYPSRVEPAAFNSAHARRHLALFNVRHFIARWETTQAAFEQFPDWRHVATHDAWRLYEASADPGGYVTIPVANPIGVRLKSAPAGHPWKQAGVDWFYAFGAVNTPFALLDAGMYAPDIDHVVSEAAFRDHLAAVEGGDGEKLSFTPLPDHYTVDMIEFSDRTIRFRTTAIGLPHIISVTHFPNWRVSGAHKIYRITPCFMLIYPSQEEVTLTYGRVASDHVGRGLSWMAWALAAGLAVRRMLKLRRARKEHRT